MIKASVLKNSVRDLAKFLGGKPTNIHAVLSSKGLTLVQSSPIAAAKINISADKTEGIRAKRTASAVFSHEWVKSSLSKAPKEEVIKISFAPSSTVMEWPGCSTSITNAIDEDVAGPASPDREAKKVPDHIASFIRKHSSILKIKSHFSTRPLAATIGTYKSCPFIMVNDQYHGMIIIDNNRLGGKFESFSLDSSAMAAIVFDPSSMESESLDLTLSEGRIFIEYPNAVYEVPSFEPSAIPSSEEIEQLVSLARVKNTSHRALVHADSLSEALSISRFGETPSQSFLIKRSQQGLDLIYSSASVNSRGSVKGPVQGWKTEISVDPNMAGDITDQIILQSKTFKIKEDALAKKASRMEIKKSRDGNVVVLVNGIFGHADYPSMFGFLVTR